MNKTLLIITAIISSLYFQPTYAVIENTSPLIWHDYSIEAFEQAKQENKPVFMVIKADWCHACKLYEDNTLNTAEVSNLLNSYFIPILVDFDREKKIVSKYSVVGPPTTILFSSEGKEIASVPGFISKEELLDGLENSLSNLKNGSMEDARLSFQGHNVYEALSFGNTTPRTAIPVEADSPCGERLFSPIQSTLLLFILVFSIGSAYALYKSF
jgi:thioredoxin-related protein